MDSNSMSKIVNNILNCSYEQGVLHKFYFIQAQKIYKFLTKNSGNYYLKPNDIISNRPALFGYHEPHLEALFSRLAETHGDFLIDIGANIGMTSVMVGHAFDVIHCVEPNKIISKILDVNIILAGLQNRTSIHQIGLGYETKVEKLHVPRFNFGGAYVQNGNAYSDTVIAGLREQREEIVQDIEILEADNWVKKIFVGNPNWKNGVVKIDVEGFEHHIFTALLRHIPKDVSIVVIMENFLEEIDFDRFASKNHKLTWFGFYKQKKYLKSFIYKVFGMSSYYQQIVAKIDRDSKAPHDLIVYLSPN